VARIVAVRHPTPRAGKRGTLSDIDLRHAPQRVAASTDTVHDAPNLESQHDFQIDPSTH
jgi:hypothetical protein